jgi:Phosphoenolpyruvate synthase/pyruvate phosphate dikinase
VCSSPSTRCPATPTGSGVSACRGLGDALVSGGIDADEYLLARDGSELGASRIEREHRLLAPAMLRELAALGVRLSRQGGPRDVEWTILNGELWVLQDRPVTAIATPVAAAHRIVWDNSNIQESYCGVTTPLTFSFARDAYASVYEQTMRAVGISESTIAEHRPTLRTLLGLLQGRVYYNLNSWYRGLLLLPAFRRNKADMERMMGVEEPVDFVADEAPSFTERVGRLPQLARTLVRLLGAFATLDRDTSRFLSRVDARLRAVDRETVARLPMNELMAMLEELRTDCMDRWTTPIINDFYVMMSVGRLRRFVVRALRHSNEDAVDVAMQRLLGGAAVAVSAAPAALMLQLADTARQDPDVYESLHDREGAAALAAAGEASVTFARTLHNLLDEYGDRCMGELKLESRSLRDDPAFVVRMLRNYLAQSSVAPASHGEGDAPRAARAVEIEIGSRLGPFGRMRFRRALSAARTGIARRETLRLVRTRLFGVHRDVYRAVGRQLHERGRLDRPDDIFYLATDEIRAEWEGTAISNGLAELARSRRAEFGEYEKVTPPNRIVTTGTPSETMVWRSPAAAVHSGRLLRGLGCSAGVVTGVVRIVRTPSDDLAIDGHILVAPRTDPGWAPLFPSAGGIIVERGSLLSHSAVLARELRLPAVVGVPGILETLRDGERVRIDGSTGTIERLEVPCE